MSGVSEIIEALQTYSKLTDKEVMEALKDVDPKLLPSKWGGKKVVRAPTGYNNFVKEKSSEAKELYPEKKTLTVVADMWKKLSEEEKKKYTKEKGDVPKKPTKTTAYQVFLKRMREDDPERNYREFVSIYSAEWKALDDSDKEKYIKKANKLNEGFEEKLTEYNNSTPSTPKKLSKSEQAKADQPDLYEINPKTGRYILKKGAKTPTPQKKAEKKSKKSKKKESSSEDEDSDSDVSDSEIV